MQVLIKFKKVLQILLTTHVFLLDVNYTVPQTKQHNNNQTERLNTMNTTYAKYLSLCEKANDPKTLSEQDKAFEELEKRGFYIRDEDPDSPVHGRLLAYEEVIQPRVHRGRRCIQCEYPLNSEGECPRGCTDSGSYFFQKGFEGR